MKVAVMTDTNSGISVEEGRRLGVYVIPMPVLIDGQTYYEGVNLAHDEFYRFMLAGRPYRLPSLHPEMCWICGTVFWRSTTRWSIFPCPAV